ncbi:hypothetical protein RJZ56_001393 [Blastomyces dermatitidis]|uniref:Alpha/beta hydrolase n=2 Tax=Ajellomyces dermatitidis TaxID=5039 RepID=F2T340_AJEDA|nr:alpha/beta hydrolase [Blastomyces dermatitidis ER-3]EEQ87567.1 alpha/beta hydrolase [Blastomyces dermatitidis ER-3]EGE77842.1 alpha/beta hydrolase [Blastomyces dermatitidis ATCC 18188]EQL38133.1 hypothetical protein BDFG_00513 [Blastomyces dermatitidis ATCC 26199]
MELPTASSLNSAITQDWNKDTISSLVPIETHKLFLSVSGPPRGTNAPVVVVLPGAGETVRSYPALERIVSTFARILLYDRSGLGRSEDGPSRPTAVSAASELSDALDAAGICPPFILVGHSYGGIIARELLHIRQNDVAGMVLAEAATERQCQFFQIPDPNVAAVLGGLNFAQVTGLRADSMLSRDEWRARAIERPRGMASSQAEADSFVEVCETLAVKGQFERQAMGNRPVSIIRCNGMRDYERLYAKGVEVGNGTQEQRKAFRDLLDSWDEVDRELKEEQLRLSSKCHFVHVADCGHNVQLTRPDVIAEEIKWVLDNIC